MLVTNVGFHLQTEIPHEAACVLRLCIPAVIDLILRVELFFAFAAEF